MKYKFKFKRYKIYHNGKDYHVLIPQGTKDNLWIRDWDDWWYDTFITGSLNALKTLVASFAILGFNPYSVIYLPVGNDKIAKGISGNPENGTYDIVFKTNRVHFKDKDWKVIRQKLKKTPCSTYTFTYDEDRIKEYFDKQSKHLNQIPESKILKKAGADSWLAVGTAFFSYPRAYYQYECHSLWEWLRDDFTEEYDHNYDEKRDSCTCDMDYFCYRGYHKYKTNHENPGCGLILEIYDMDIANKYMNDKDYLIPNAKTRLVEGITYCTYSGTNVFKITLGA